MARWLKQSTSADVPIGPFLDSTDGVTAETALTITQPDIRLKKNGGAWAQKNAAQTLTHEENGYYEVTLDSTDTNTLGLLRLAVNESGALPVWEDFIVVPANVYDSLISGSDTLDVTMSEAQIDQIVNEVWDETLTTNNHNGANTAGRRLRTLNADVTIFSGTATAGGVNTITAPSTASTVNDVYVGATITLTGGTGVGQTRRIINYVGSTKVITVDRNWATNPASGTTFDILAGAGSPIAVEGTIVSATGTTAVLGSEASSTDDIYVNGIIAITSGTGAGQYRDITGYVGSTKTVTVATWTTNPDSTSGYAIIPSGAQSNTGGGSTAPTAAEVATAVLTTAMTEAYSTDGGTATLAQALYELLARDQETSISGTTMTVKKRDGSTTAMTLTLNDASNPTSVTRAS